MISIVETERLTLRTFTPEDAPFILELVNDPTFLENIGDKEVRNLEDAKKHISKNIISSYSKNGYGAYIVIIKDTNEPIGMWGFFKRDQFEYADIGYAFLPEFTGKGFATESSIAILNYGIEYFKFKKVLAFTSLKNDPSSRLLEKIGLKFIENVQYEAEKVKLYST